MFFLIMIATILALWIILPPPSSTGYTGKREKDWCPPHVWDYNKDGQLQCKQCFTKPGSSSRE